MRAHRRIRARARARGGIRGCGGRRRADAAAGRDRQAGGAGQGRQAREEGGRARVQAGARAAGDGPAQGDQREARGGEVDVVHGDRRLRVSEQARAADRLHLALRRDDAAARQAADHDAGRRARVRVLLRRQGDDRVCAGGEPGRGRRRSADDRRGAEGRLRQGVDLLSVHRPAGFGPVRGADDGREARVLHRSVGSRRRREDRHGGVGERRRLPADLDRRRRQAAAAGPGDVPPDPLRPAPRDGAVELAARSRAAAGRVHVGEGAGGREDGVRQARRCRRG